MIYVIIFFILVFIIAPISLLFHEIGHIVGSAFMRASTIRLTIGLGKPLWHTKFANIEIVIRRFFLINSVTSTVRNTPFRKREKIFITIMGPLFSGILTLMTYIAYHALIASDILYVFFLFNLWLLIINLIPFKIGHKQSDGYTVCSLVIHHFKMKRIKSA